MRRRDCVVANCVLSNGATWISPTCDSMSRDPFIWGVLGIARRKHRASRSLWMIVLLRTSGCGRRPLGIGNPTTGYLRAPAIRDQQERLALKGQQVQLVHKAQRDQADLPVRKDLRV